jgi:hypothetical protein
MKIILFIFFVLPILAVSPVWAQVLDDFSDGNFSHQPTWTGDINEFIINNEGRLQLQASAPGQAYLATASEVVQNAEWQCHIQMQFNPSAANFAEVWLMADRHPFAEARGYFVRIGGSSDDVRLYRQDGASEPVLLIDGRDDVLDISVVELDMRARRDSNGLWQLEVRMHGENIWVQEGEATDAAYNFSRLFGVRCQFTSTRADKFSFDEFVVTGDVFKDETAPAVDSVYFINEHNLRIICSEPLDRLAGTTTANYRISPGGRQPISATISADTPGQVDLFFDEAFVYGQDYSLFITALQDTSGNIAQSISNALTYSLPFRPHFLDVVITEVMADPTPPRSLPEVEYIEILNTKDRTVVIDSGRLQVGRKSSHVPKVLLAPHTYTVLCADGDVDEMQDFGQVQGISRWPALKNAGDTISLWQGKNLLHAIAYTDHWYRTSAKEDGGWSLEMIDVSAPCHDEENWIASGAAAGGTPGAANASQAERTDVQGPTLAGAIATTDTTLLIRFSESVHASTVFSQNIILKPILQIADVDLEPLLRRQLNVRLSQPVAPGVVYTISMENVSDCNGNIMTTADGSADFVLPGSADSSDIVINEILFNPRPGGVDFVELFNRSDKHIDIKNWIIASEDADGIWETGLIARDHFIVAPQAYLVLTADANLLQADYPSAPDELVWEIDDMPSYPDDGGIVVLADGTGSIIDRAAYSAEFHAIFLRDDEGVSLERLSPAAASDNPASWLSAASASGYATPGRQNSQHSISQHQETLVLVDPPIFAPLSPGPDSFTNIMLKTATPGTWASIKIFDAQGRLVRDLVNHESVPMDGAFRWEGEDDDGSKVRVGYYIIFVDLVDATGQVRSVKTKVAVAARF